jgi:hypothetical protein
LDDFVSHVCYLDQEGGSVLEALLRDKSAKAPLISEVDRNDLVATAIWFVWWSVGRLRMARWYSLCQEQRRQS